ncbi:MAG: hypothetical protein ACOX4R_08865 [Lentihominibacter sp.]
MMRLFNTGNRHKLFSFLVCTTVVFSIGLTMAGCGDKSGGTYDEPEITAEYLMGEYAEQLLTDGAEPIQGSVEMTETDETYTLTVAQKEIVPSENYKDGYYIADRNLKTELYLDNECRIVWDNNGTYEVGNTEEFISDYNGKPDTIYTVYCFGDLAELIVVIDPADMI